MDISDELSHEHHDTEMNNALEKVFMLDEIDPRMAELEPQTTPVDELESFLVDPRDPTKMLKVEKGLSIKIKEKLKDFLSRNINVFSWRHEDMVGINPKVSCHHFKIDFKATHKGRKKALNRERYETLKEGCKS